jgi:hypothetical protein
MLQFKEQELKQGIKKQGIKKQGIKKQGINQGIPHKREAETARMRMLLPKQREPVETSLLPFLEVVDATGRPDATGALDARIARLAGVSVAS